MKERLIKNYFFAVIRGKSEQDAMEIARNAILGGIKNIEITFTTPNAGNVIEKLVKEFKTQDTVVIGAGTVLTVEEADIAKKAGAKFLVSPHLSKELANFCNHENILYIPGCGTVTEIVTASNLGAKVIKLFPGEVLGVNFIKALKGPFPDIDVMPSGGVTVANVREWRDSGACAVGVGSSLTKNIEDFGYYSVKKIASEFVQQLD